jgi:hypothetical protein
LFHPNIQNNLRRIPNSFVAKLMMPIVFLPEFECSSRTVKSFFSIQ